MRKVRRGLVVALVDELCELVLEFNELSAELDGLLGLVVVVLLREEHGRALLVQQVPELVALLQQLSVVLPVVLVVSL